MGGKRENDYFNDFINLVEYSCKAAKLLNEILNQFDSRIIEKNMKDMHDIEHGADVQRHIMMKKLAREFITPIEREDIIKMAYAIDNITNMIEEVLIHIYMFHISKIRTDAVKLSELVLKCCDSLRLTLIEFRFFKKALNLQERVIEVNDLEELGDKIYMDATRKLYATCSNPIEVGAWQQILHDLERCCDACENVANMIEDIILKSL